LEFVVYNENAIMLEVTAKQ